MKVWPALLIAGVLHGLAVVVLLRPAPPEHPALIEPWMHRLDGNSDGVLSLEEAQARGLPGAPRWDLDGSGAISPGELEAMLWVLDPAVLYNTAPSVLNE